MKTIRLLIADDSADDTELVTRQFRQAGYALTFKRVDTKTAFRAALAELPWDVIIADYSMPGFTGMDALVSLINSGLDLPFILISGVIGEALAVAAMKAGAHDYLMKDNLTRLVPAVEREIREAAVRSAKRAIERERRQLIDRLKEAVRARDEFLLIASHELKTPLSSLMLYSKIIQRLQAGAPSPETKERRLTDLQSALDQQLQRLAKLIDNLLDVSRIAIDHIALNPEKLDLAQVVRRVMHDFHEDIAKAGCRATIRAKEPVTGMWDPLRVEQIVMNLVSNAVKYAPGSEIEVTVGSRGGMARLTIKDHGPGIAKNDRERIFKRFERSTSTAHLGGLGLGLYITRQLVQAHSGSIRLESEPGKGSTFIVELPLAGAAIGPTTQAA